MVKNLRGGTSAIGSVLADQVLYSAVNVVATILASRQLGGVDFGRYAFGSIVILAALGLSRSALVDPLMISQASEGESEDDASVVFAAFYRVGLAGLTATVILFALQVDPWISLLPVLVAGAGAFEIARGTAIRARQAKRTLLPQGLWLAVTVVLMSSAGSVGPATYLVFWLAPAWLAAFGVVATAGSLRREPLSTYWNRHRPTAVQTVAEFSLTTAAGFVGPISLALVGATEALGSVRLLQTVFGPLNVLFASAGGYFLPRWRLIESAPGSTWRTRNRWITVVAFCIAVIWGASLAIVPMGWLVGVFGSNWTLADELLVPFTVAIGLGATFSGPVLTLRARGMMSTSMAARRWVVFPTVALPLAGAIWYGGQGFVGGFLLGNLGGAIIWRRYGRSGL